MKIKATVKIDFEDIRSDLEQKGYELITETKDAVEFIINDSQESGLLYSEKENIRMFFESDKFKSIPNKDFFEFLKKY